MTQGKYKNDGTDIVDPHTNVKYRLYRDYLSDYIRVYFQNSRVPKLRIFIADLFCGGGLAKDESGGQVFGSPLIAIDVCQTLQKNLSEERGRSIEIDPHFFFNDIAPDAIKNLKAFIQDLFPDHFASCSFSCAAFEEIYPVILARMKALESSSGNRKFFFIDPYGYSQVPMHAIQMIKVSGKSEILWNFMIDYAAHYWTPENVHHIDFGKMFAASDSQKDALIAQINALKTERDWHAIRHAICALIHENSYFATMSDFAIQMDTSRKFMTMIHLADSPKARDVMTGTHWTHGNVTRTYNYNGLEYEDLTRQTGQDLSLFTFSDAERCRSRERAHARIYDMISNHPGISFPEIVRRYAAQYSSLQEIDFHSIILGHGKDIIWRTVDGEETRSKSKMHSFQTSPQFSFKLPVLDRKKTK